MISRRMKAPEENPELQNLLNDIMMSEEDDCGSVKSSIEGVNQYDSSYSQRV